MPRVYKCKICNKHFAMEWAKDNHQKLCEENENAIKSRSK